MVQAVADGFGDDGLRRDARELLFEPDFESQHERLALFLAHGTALVGRSAADRLLNRVEKSDAIEGFARDGCGAALGDFEELSSQMCPAEGEGNATLLHRTALKKFWNGDKPTADDFIRELAKPFPLELSMNHLELMEFEFAVSSSEEAVTTELTRTPMTTRSVCEAVGADPDAVFREIAEISQQAVSAGAKIPQ